jgi:hypothetical protein
VVTLLWTLEIYFNVFNVLCFCSGSGYLILVLVNLLWTLEIYYNVYNVLCFFFQDAGVHALSNVCHVDVERISKRKPGEVVCTQNSFFFLTLITDQALSTSLDTLNLFLFLIFA